MSGCPADPGKEPRHPFLIIEVFPPEFELHLPFFDLGYLDVENKDKQGRENKGQGKRADDDADAEEDEEDAHQHGITAEGIDAAGDEFLRRV